MATPFTSRSSQAPEGEKKETSEISGPIDHTVKRGETISSICKLYGITENEFCSWNVFGKVLN
jgi:hypothetical protein